MKLSVTLFCVLLSVVLQAQDNKEEWYSFWIGKWQVTWDEGDGKIGSGTNHVVRILDGKVIQENFSVTFGANKGYLGTSLSVYNPTSQQWHQGYADNQGAYFNFIGDKMGDKYVFKTLPVVKEDKEIIQRMVFYDITPSSLTWDWESTQDGGRTWKLNWRVNYKKIEG